MAFLVRMQQTGRPPEHHELNQYLRDTREAEFLFGPEVVEFIKEVHEKTARYRAHPAVWEPMLSGPERQQKYKDVREAEEAVRECWVRACTSDSSVFRKYLELT